MTLPKPTAGTPWPNPPQIPPRPGPQVDPTDIDLAAARQRLARLGGNPNRQEGATFGVLAGAIEILAAQHSTRFHTTCDSCAEIRKARAALTALNEIALIRKAVAS